ncbi:MAG: C40 family peptidase [Bacteroidota bacterium]|nr:C40 family peptidase [Bacteroidota bacterium]
MKNFLLFLSLLSIVILTGCSVSRKMNKPEPTAGSGIHSEVIIKKKVPAHSIDTKNVLPEDVVTFAETLIGIKYKYGSESVERGFDCSGFVNYVFNHFNISVPRITIDFTNAGEEVPIAEGKPGDIILFTGTDAKSGVVGHIGIITQNNNGDVKFIHASTSRGVIISGMNSYFLPRFVKVNRLFPEGM